MASLTERLRPAPVAVFTILTLLIWTNRIWLAWTNAEDAVAEKLVWSTPITLFVLAAAYLLVRMLTGRASGRTFATVVRVFAAGTVVYWAIRIAIILTGDHTAGFKAVHTVLALVSAAAAVWAASAVRGRGAVSDAQRDGDPATTAR